MTDAQKIKLLIYMITSFYESEECADCRASGWLDAIFEVLCYEAE